MFVSDVVANSMETCSFKSIVGSSCSHNRRDKHKPVKLVALQACKKDVSEHKSAWSFSGVESKIKLAYFIRSQRMLVLLTSARFINLSLALDGVGTPVHAKFLMRLPVTVLAERKRSPLKATEEWGERCPSLFFREQVFLFLWVQV